MNQARHKEIKEKKKILEKFCTFSPDPDISNRGPVRKAFSKLEVILFFN